MSEVRNSNKWPVFHNLNKPQFALGDIVKIGTISKYFIVVSENEHMYCTIPITLTDNFRVKLITRVFRKL